MRRRLRLPIRVLLWATRALLLVCLVGIGPASVAHAAEPQGYALVEPKAGGAAPSLHRHAGRHVAQSAIARAASTSPPSHAGARWRKAPPPGPRSCPRYQLFCSLLR